MIRNFNAEQAREIVHMHRRGARVETIAKRYGHPDAVRKIVRGESYRDVLHRADRTCQCCLVGDRQDRNITAALKAIRESGREAKRAFECVLCGAGITRAAGKVSRAHGTPGCIKCDGRKRND